MGKLADKLRKFKNGQQGAALVLVALAIVALIGFTALAVDGGYLYFRHTRLQDISDAIAIAAGIEVVSTSGNDKVKKDASFQKAIEYAQLHELEVANQDKTGYTATITWGNEAGDMIISFPEGLSKIMVQMTIEANTFYARVLGTTSTPVAVTSIVQIGQASEQQGNMIPVAILRDNYERNIPYQLSLEPGDGFKGNYRFLDFPELPLPYDKLKFKDYLVNGYPGTLSVGDKIDTLPGEMVGQVTHINTRVNECNNHCQCTFDNINESCPRIVVVPIFDQEDFEGEPGKHPVTITGFAKFFIESYDEGSKILTGYFLEQLEPSEIAEGDDQFTTQSVNLIR